MANTGKILVSMTSYPGRIKNVGMAVFLLLTKQTKQPDEIHLWLAEPQFPNKEADLPMDLRKVLAHPKVVLHWLPENTYVHKRHEIFKTAGKDDCVFLIDDDVRYADNLIETVMGVHQKHPNCIVCYNQYSVHKYNGRRIIYTYPKIPDTPHINKYRWCGQSMIPMSVYPTEILDSEHQAVRNRTSPVSDECWFQPWVVYYDIPIVFLHYGWGDDIDPNNGKNRGLVGWSHRKDANGYEKRDNWLNSVLMAYPPLLNKYKTEFNYG